MKSKLSEEDTYEWQQRKLVDKNGLKRVAGVDISFVKNDSVNACACVAVLTLPDLEVSCFITLNACRSRS